MTRDAEKIVSSAIQMGHANLETMELARRFCLNMKFVPHGGSGLVEEQTGLPVGMRQIKCPVANGDGMAMNLDWLASDFYEANCIHCDQRRPTGDLPHLGTVLEDRRRKIAVHQVENETQMAKLHNEWNIRVEQRRSLAVTSSEAMKNALEDIEILDSDPVLNHNTMESQLAERRLSALAERAPEQFTQNIVNLAVDLVSETHIVQLLEPLRHLAIARTEFAPVVCSAALGALNRGATPAAGHCIADLSSFINLSEVDDSVIRSLIWLAGAPSEQDLGQQDLRVDANDPTGLQAIVDLDAEHVVRILEEMLPAPERRIGLILPSAAIQSRLPTSDFDRASAAGAIRGLGSTHPEVAAQMVPTMLLNLNDPSTDEYEFHPSFAVIRALAKLIVLDIGDVIPQIEQIGRATGKELRESLFDIYQKVADFLDPHDRWREVGDPLPNKSRRDALFDQLLSLAMSRIAGDWGDDIRFSAGQLIEDLAQVDPARMFTNLASLLGSFLLLIGDLDRKPTNSLLNTPTASPSLHALEELGRRQAISNSTVKIRNAIESSAGVDPGGVCQAIAEVIEQERTSDQGADTLWHLIELLGSVGSQYGDEPHVLQTILPILHSYVVDAGVLNRARALNAWNEIGQIYQLPSSLVGLLPALITDPYVVVIQSVLRLARNLTWPDAEKAQLLIYARNILRADIGAELISEAISTSTYLTRDDERSRAAVELEALHAAGKLDSYELRRALKRPWLRSTTWSPEMADLRLRQAADPAINDRFNSSEGEQLCALLECGDGLSHLALSDLITAAIAYAPDYPLASAEFAEVAWRATRLSDGKEIMDAVLSEIPNLPAYALQRGLALLVRANIAADISASSGSSPQNAMRELADVVTTLSGNDSKWVQNLLRQVQIRTTIRHLLAGTTADSLLSLRYIALETQATHDPASDIRQRADQLSAAGVELASISDNVTKTGDYIRAFARLCEIAGHLLRADAAALDADIQAIKAHSTAAQRNAQLLSAELSELFAPNDPLGGLLISELIAMGNNNEDVAITSLLSRMASLPLPMLFVRGPRRKDRSTSSQPSLEPDSVDSPPSIAVVLASIDGRLVTGPEVLRPHHVYELSVEVQTDPWPDWVNQLDIELLSHLSDNELTRPTFTWRRSQIVGDTHLSQNKIYKQSGPLKLQFGLSAGMSAQPVLMNVKWRGDREGLPISQQLDVAGHRELRLRPFDASKDHLTDYPMFDERLLNLYARLTSANYDPTQIQSFCRLLTAICRVGLRMTWDMDYKRGSHVSERKFHDDLHQGLLDEPELGGRIERGKRLAHGFLDVRHDGITAELKVERRTPVTKESATKYIGQPTQYAAADGARISILAILDMSPKQLPIGTPENYLFVLEPQLHGLTNSEAPSLVAVLIINGNLPTPSSWSRHKLPITHQNSNTGNV